MATANQHLLILTAIGPNSAPLLEHLMRYCTQCGCNILRAHMMSLGQEHTITLLLSGTWSVIAKIEALVPSLEQKLNINTIVRRTTNNEAIKRSLPYTVQITAADRPGILQEMSDFFNSQHLSIQELQADITPTYKGHIPVLTLTLSVDIPEKTHLATLRERFMIYCEDRNLDAILEPQKF